MPRRSSRAKPVKATDAPVARRKRKTGGSNSSEEDYEVSNKKRRKTVPLKGKSAKIRDCTVSQKAPLDGFCDTLPCDIILETFSHLQTQDLLRLIRTTKPIRNLLLDRSSATSTWKQARWNHRPTLPDIPGDMSEPEYANLLFDTHCHVCMTPRSMQIIWAARIRCCAECLADWFYTEGELRTHLHKTCGFTPEMASDFNIPLTVPGCPMWDEHGRSLQCYSIEIAEIYLEEYKKTLEIDDPRAKEQWLIDKKNDIFVRQEHAVLSDEWILAQHDARGLELVQLKEQRLDQILDRLSQIGWENEVSRMGGQGRARFMACHVVRKPKLLTDKDWSDIRGTMISEIEDIRQQRLRRERNAMISTRCLALSQAIDGRVINLQDIPTPHVVDIAFMEPFRSLIFSEATEVEVSEQDFVDILGDLPAAAIKWQQFMKQQLLARVAKNNNLKTKPAEEVLDYVGTTFQCSRNRERVMVWSDVITHSCMNREPWWSIREYYDSSSCESEDKWAAVKAYRADTWSTSCILAKPRKPRIQLLDALGFPNPKRTLWSEIQGKEDTIFGVYSTQPPYAMRYNYGPSHSSQGPWLIASTLGAMLSKSLGWFQKLIENQPECQFFRLDLHAESAGLALSDTLKCIKCSMSMEQGDVMKHTSQDVHCWRSTRQYLIFEVCKSEVGIHRSSN